MKKTYAKPFVVKESFQLDAAIAAACSADGGVALHHGENTCNAIDEIGSFYYGAACVINLINPGGDSNDTICYHGPVTTGGITFLKS